MMKNLLVIICLLSMLLLFSVNAQADALGAIGMGSDGLNFLFAADNFMFNLDLGGGLSSDLVIGVYHFKDKNGKAFAGYPYLTIETGQINKKIAEHNYDTAFGYGVGLAWVLDNDYLGNDRMYIYISGTLLCLGTGYEINKIEYDGGTGFIGKLKLSYTVFDHINERFHIGERLNIYGAINYVYSNRLGYQEIDYGFGIECLF